MLYTQSTTQLIPNVFVLFINTWLQSNALFVTCKTLKHCTQKLMAQDKLFNIALEEMLCMSDTALIKWCTLIVFDPTMNGTKLNFFFDELWINTTTRNNFQYDWTYAWHTPPHTHARANTQTNTENTHTNTYKITQYIH